MQVSVESTGNLERRINFSLPAEQLESSISGRLREIARTARIKGFRPGKVPARVIEQRFGEQVKAEVMGGLVRQTLDSAIREHDLRVAGVPSIDRAGEGELDFVATVEVVPDFGDIDVAKLTVVRNTAEVADADIDLQKVVEADGWRQVGVRHQPNSAGSTPLAWPSAPWWHRHA